MINSRQKRAKLNIVVSLMSEIVTLVCGLIVPRVLLGTFGSEAYGATTSITQFLGYITLLEGGIGGVARAALYKPLAENDINGVSLVVSEIKRFFRILALIFIPYVIILACFFPRISHIKVLDWASCFVLVVVISISSFAQYFIGISYSVLLQAAQKTYITKLVGIGGTVLNALFVVALVNLNCNLIIVKLGSSIVFGLKPIILWLYVKKNFNLINTKERNEKALEQKWAGLGQHLAYFLHNHTDVAVLTILSNLKTVAVYSVYQMIISNIQILTSSFSTGMESIFGDMLAKKEYKLLSKTFDYYESLISMISVILFSVTALLIVPFIKLYTKGINDTNYIQPVFACVLLCASIVYCLRMPYHSMIIAAGHFRQTQIAAYGEAVINIMLSVILVKRFGLLGVAIGTVVATSFRFMFYVIYLSENIVQRPIRLFIKRETVNCLCFITICFLGQIFVQAFPQSNYLQWVICGIINTAIATIVTIVIYYLFYRDDLKGLLGKVLH